MLIVNRRTSIRVDDVNLAALATWLSVVSVASVWSILLVSRYFNLEKGIAISHRIVMGAMGAIIGCGAVALQRFLLIDTLPSERFFATLNGEWPLEATMVTFFVASFTLLRWWKNGDPMRKSRLNVGAICVAVVICYGIGLVTHFSMPWPIMFAAVVALSLQIGSSRFSAKRRAELKQPFAISA